MRNTRMIKEAVPVTDLRTGCLAAYAGWQNGSGRLFVLPEDESDPREVAYVNAGPRGVYVFRDQLADDRGLYAYCEQNGGR